MIESVIDGAQPGESDTSIDASDAVVAAGMVDIHTHGAAGAQFIDGRAEDVARAARLYARHGVTAFLATVGGTQRSIEAGIRAAVSYIEADRPEGAARCLGIHLEGPFISPAWPGAFVPSTIVAPDAALLRHYADLARGNLRRVTLAPEVPGMRSVLEEARRLGISCSAGHSGATYADMEAAVSGGVSSTTHLFNAMSPLHHREPGIVGATLTDDRVTAELIADGVHIAPAVMGLVAQREGLGRHRPGERFHRRSRARGRSIRARGAIDRRSRRRGAARRRVAGGQHADPGRGDSAVRARDRASMAPGACLGIARSRAPRRVCGSWFDCPGHACGPRRVRRCWSSALEHGGRHPCPLTPRTPPTLALHPPIRTVSPCIAHTG